MADIKMRISGSGKPIVLIAVLATVIAPRWTWGHTQETVTRRLADDLFMAGSDLQITQGAPGDAILAGGWISTAGTVNGDEVAAGAHISLAANVDGGLYAAGGHVHLDGKVARNARIAGGNVEVGPNAAVQGGLTIGGGQVEVNGQVGKYLQVGAARARIDGHVGGDVDVASGSLDVGPGAVIDGLLTYYGPRPATVAAGAQIRGGVHYVERKQWGYGVHPRLRGFGAGAWLWLIGWMVVGSVLLTLWPGFARSVTNVALHRPWMALLLGFVVAVCAPIAVVLLLISVIGIPLALLAFCLYLTLLPIGFLASAAALGEWLLPRVRRGGEISEGQRILMLLGVMVVLFVVTRIPVLGGIGVLLVVLVGVGSLMMASVARYREA